MERDRTDSLERDEEQAVYGIPPALEMDPAEYLPDMDEFDLTEPQKVELLQTLWDICRRFIETDIDIGEIDPCGQIFADVPEFASAAPDSVQSSFSRATEARKNDEEEDPA